ncbi:MAG: replication factor C large subunit [Candidatus Woesearchaeota archaeon]
MNCFFVKKLNKVSEIIGQGKAISTISSFLNNFRKGEGLLLYGPYGSGKTSSIHAFAKEFNYDILELSANETRNQSNIEEFLSKATGQMSLFATKKIILLDELDGLSGMNDRGAATVIANYIKKSTFPIIMTCLNPYEKRISSIKKISKLVEFQSLNHKDVVEIIKKVLKEENVIVDEKTISRVARECNGDARAALNDIFVVALLEEYNKKNKINILINEENEISSERKRTNSMMDALIRVLKSKDSDVYLGAYDDVDEDLDKIFLWLDQNVPNEYLEISDLSKAYDELSKADVFFGRIRKWQYYRFYVYCYQLLSAGIALAKKVKYPIPPKYKESTRLLKYWQANMSYAKRKLIIEKISENMNVSNKKAMKDIFPNLITALVHDKKLIEELDLTSEEIEWVKKYLNNKK